MAKRSSDPRLSRFWRWFDTDPGAPEFGELEREVRDEHIMYPEDLEPRLGSDDIVVIDTRDADSYRQDHVRTAINIPLDAMIDDVEIMAPFKHKTIALVCNTGSTTSFYGAVYLLRKGYRAVYSLDQGINGWIASGFEVERG